MRTLAALALGLLLVSPGALRAQDPPSGGTGHVAGRIVDAETGRPLPATQVLVVETERSVLTDPEGRYRTPALPVGDYTLEVRRLGYGTKRLEGVAVTVGETTLLNVSLSSSAIEVEGISVAVERVTATSTEAGLLAMQRAAPVVTDGISSEQISRSPDSNAADALARVTGVSVVDDRFVVVRGLAERYSNTLLNGLEVSSPEPTQRIVPMDVFPASLLESVVTTKAATPDRPGDFAGGSVEIRTKEFPDEEILEFKTSVGYNSLSTFETRPVFLPRGRDFLTLDGKSRDPGTPQETEAFAESVRSEWVPPRRTVPPDFGLGVTWGGQTGEFERALGWVLSVDYGQKTGHYPDRFWALVQNFDDGDAVLKSTYGAFSSSVDVGIVANLSQRLGSSTTLSLRNLFTREATEEGTDRLGIDPENQGPGGDRIQSYQVKYIARTVFQSQLEGTHLLPSWLGRSTLDWSGALSYAGRDEPENRSVNYLENIRDARFEIHHSKRNDYWFRFLDEWSWSAQLDWSFPVGLVREGDALFKLGGRYRDRSRTFDAQRFSMTQERTLPDGIEVSTLPPELLFTPENIGRSVIWEDVTSGGLPYDADESVVAGYVMADLNPLSFFRLVGGLRVEAWDLEVEPESQAGAPEVRTVTDYLWSANATLSLLDDVNLRLATYRTVSRPDPRELSLTVYTPVVGQCETRGNPSLREAKINNYDVRWEWFPAPGELVSLSGFVKDFTDPFIQVVSVVSLQCKFNPANAASARTFGGELEMRKNLGFMGLAPLFVGANLTYTDGSITPRPENDIGLEELPLPDQSEVLVNGSLTWAQPDSRFTATLLYNYFSDRVRRYGQSIDGGAIRPPDVLELGRGTLDAKVSFGVGGGTSLSLSAKNLTGQRIEWVQPTTEAGNVPVLVEDLGVSVSLSATVSVW